MSDGFTKKYLPIQILSLLETFRYCSVPNIVQRKRSTFFVLQAFSKEKEKMQFETLL